jgi:cytidine deaminase
MNKEYEYLIKEAKAIHKDYPLSEGCTAGGVGAAIRTKKGNVYTGICFDLGSGLGFCAEVAAIAEMLKNHDTWIDMVVAVSGDDILPPCGRCRETMVQIDERNIDCRVIIDYDRDVSLRELLPYHRLARE